MANRREETIVESVPPGGWLRQFASFYHQDYGLLAKDFRAGAAVYVEGLSPAQRKALRVDLYAFLAENEDLPPNSLKRKWMKLGAQWCQRDIDMRGALNEVVRML